MKKLFWILLFLMLRVFSAVVIVFAVLGAGNSIAALLDSESMPQDPIERSGYILGVVSFPPILFLVGLIFWKKGAVWFGQRAFPPKPNEDRGINPPSRTPLNPNPTTDRKPY